MAQLFIVGTPIGNLGDITIRALEVLRSVDIIAAEDTRHSLRLLNHYTISKPMISCHGHNEDRSAQRIIQELEQGRSIAYVSDAGTPGISDPGTVLVRRVRQAGFPVVPIPGASALTSIASVSGFSGRRLIFDGFLSPKAGRRKKQLQELLNTGDNCIIYESPFRIVKLLGDLADLDPERPVVIGRELTKSFEEILGATAREAFEDFASRSTIKGEFALVISGSSPSVEDGNENA
ncbi:16S rRNA (cytidine(1402)-2'-O)-methyltransferase [Spirochaeta lutea]|uniref:Ribosomal RNA small subunit methyltransferase I n=1 Tax=Spirochaeta lutea TaxID=1480694 RepID=A0A098QUQ1_9SPIO|nr:16S rRNA (cytidine(1402)-2'-O)-methyltransferase [Spirochaeta lutea]KGE71585.1 16S rRNA methyltransferase [Spirochaeta lutea]